MIRTISLIGAGNLATRLGSALRQAGLQFTQVYSRTGDSARALAEQLQCPATSEIEQVNLDADLVLFALKDDALDEVLNRLPLAGKLIAHTAGSLPLSVLQKHASRCGVFYPLQTFSKQREVDFRTIPFCIEGSDSAVLTELTELAGRLSDKVEAISSEQRQSLHLAAVFTCNFVNHFYYLGQKIVEQHGVDFELLKPLITETAAKVMEMSPYQAQTGPAKRFDETIINKHLKFLDGQPELQEIYSFVSRSIFDTHKPTNE